LNISLGKQWEIQISPEPTVVIKTSKSLRRNKNCQKNNVEQDNVRKNTNAFPAEIYLLICRNKFIGLDGFLQEWTQCVNPPNQASKF
jgi:hypothetical protein